MFKNLWSSDCARSCWQEAILIDGIHGSTSFQDPYSGLQKTLDGDYDYWY